MFAALRRFRQDISGVAVIEFALIAPTLLMMLLASIDLGNALKERAAIDHVLRSGAQPAMADAGAPAVLAAMQAAASPDFTTLAGTDKSVTLDAARFCACPGSPATATACSTICTGSLPTNAYYRISATKTYQGILFARFDLAPVLQVEVR
ncbi:TadE/TadG family type IV pilus assembly protein [Paragemmobacter aquarius]|uniref:TadE/TadG family type IV pilus assembly protein n=1 Tax=Paragemmobacter aquarius TaxID=2169400 RepID=UPI00131F2515|nr:TadE/TadG family type IV pilus assembly protein [Gemmobacter aquarius]